MTAYEMQQNSDGRRPGLLIAGILLGGLTGALTSLLLAPHSGKETRKLIENNVIELRDRTAATMKSVSGKVSSKAGEIKSGVSSKATELTRQGKGMLAKQLDRISVAAQKGKTSLEG
jgi:gas vesicle protein